MSNRTVCGNCGALWDTRWSHSCGATSVASDVDSLHAEVARLRAALARAPCERCRTTMPGAMECRGLWPSSQTDWCEPCKARKEAP